jgi:hypothetical protein
MKPMFRNEPASATNLASEIRDNARTSCPFVSCAQEGQGTIRSTNHASHANRARPFPFASVTPPSLDRSARACDHLSTRFFPRVSVLLVPGCGNDRSVPGPLLALPASCHFALARRPRSRIERDDINLDLLLLYSSCIPHKSPLSPCNSSSLSSHLLYLDLPSQIQSPIREYPKEGDDPFASSSSPINSIKTFFVALSPSSPYRSFPADPDFFSFSSRPTIRISNVYNPRHLFDYSFSLVFHLGTP